ncbi:MAG: hypothetical protein GDA43_07785 [Hormoscilla sp. SP5CHS1]|nr:hypothetical protein [Hormoscilla sp. SP12CHS1]MBC6453122.1 hypothetical protein [Hormoscilla sp. SP5CHS1]
MSRTVDIFVDSQVGIKTLVEEIEFLLYIKLQLISYKDDTWYEYHNYRITLTLGEHEFENDRDMNFAEYRYHISVRAVKSKTETNRQYWRDEFARLVFQKLKASQKYPLMLVSDLQVKLEEFCPALSIAN